MRVSCLCAAVAFLTSTVVAEDWNQFRGGVAGKFDNVTHPGKWDAKTNLAWSAPMKGSGWSSPVVVGDRVFITAAESEKPSKPKGMMAGVRSMGTYRQAKPTKHSFVVVALSLADGKELWRKKVGELVPDIVHPSNTYATESPATDGQRVFTFFATTGTLVAWDLDGKELWRKEVGAYKAGRGFGTGSSLAVFEGHVFVQYDNDEKSFVIAFNSENGEQVWRDNRPAKTSWSTPIIWKAGKQAELVTCGSGIITAYNPKNGEVLWKLTGMESGFSASPAIDRERIYFGSSGPSSQGPLVAVKVDTRGEVQLDGSFKSDKIAWSRTRSGPGMCSPVVAKGRLYIPGSSGKLKVYESATGKLAYETRVPKMGTVVASLWADDDRVFILDEKGTTYVIRTGPEFELIDTNEIKDLFWSTPAIAGKTLLLRGVDKLYCIRK